MAEVQESSIPGVPLSESMKEYELAQKDGLRDGLLELTDPRNPASPIRVTRKGWRQVGYLMALLSVANRETGYFGTEEEHEAMLGHGRMALDMAAWMKLNPGGGQYKPRDGQHR